jgi:hypothetical protein
MKRGVWLAGSILSVFGLVGNLPAQPTTWRPLAPSPAVPPDPAIAVTLQPPVPMVPPSVGSSFTVPPIAPSYSSPPSPPVSAPAPSVTKPREPEPDLLPTSFQEPAAPPRPLPRVTVAEDSPLPDQEIIAVSAPGPTVAESAETEAETNPVGSLFAAERSLAPAPRLTPEPAPIVQSGVVTGLPTGTPLPPTGVPLPPTGVPLGMPVPGLGLGGPVPGAVGGAVEGLPPAGAPIPLPPVEPAAGVGYLAGGIPDVDPIHKRWYASGEYLLWWFKGMTTPVLATTSNANDAGILGAPSTRVLFGGSGINTGPYSGARFTVGCWLDMWGEEALEISAFFLPQQTTNFRADSSQYPVLARPFFSLNGGQEFSETVATPGTSTGSISISSPTSLWGAEANFLWKCWRGCCLCDCCGGLHYRFNFLAGFRYLNLYDGLSITENVKGLSTAPAPFTNETIFVNDTFTTRNQFYGGQFGIAGRAYWGPWTLDGRAKLAFGGTYQELNISGYQTFAPPINGVGYFNGGLLALPSNIGHFTHNTFSVVPELTMSVGYQINPHLRAFLGYNFLLWTNVARAGNAIDRGLDVTQIPNFPVPGAQPINVTPRRPAPTFGETDFWAQGMILGIEFVY